MTPERAYECALENGPSEELEAAIAKYSYDSYRYARCVLKGLFPAGEAAIATDSYYSYLYARNILFGPFPAGEAEIAKDSYDSYRYARGILKGPFPAGEAEITRYKDLGLDYQFRFNRDICRKEDLSEFPAYALSYAIMIGGRFPFGEPAMINSPRIWKKYQEFLNVSARSI